MSGALEQMGAMDTFSNIRLYGKLLLVVNAGILAWAFLSNTIL
jgi:hypothetical protein